MVATTVVLRGVLLDLVVAVAVAVVVGDSREAVEVIDLIVAVFGAMNEYVVAVEWDPAYCALEMYYLDENHTHGA